MWRRTRMVYTRWIKLEEDREPISRFDLPSSLCDALFRDRYGEEWVKEVKPSFFFPLVATPFIRKTGEKEAEEEHRSRIPEIFRFGNAGHWDISKELWQFPMSLNLSPFPPYVSLHLCVCVNPSIHNSKLYHCNLSKLHYNFSILSILFYFSV